MVLNIVNLNIVQRFRIKKNVKTIQLKEMFIEPKIKCFHFLILQIFQHGY